MAGVSGRAALARVGFAGSFFEDRAGSRGGFFGDFAIRRIWARDRGEGRDSKKNPAIAGGGFGTLESFSQFL
ncbi:MAG: hypothetical protein IT536_07945 [Hyphomicrobiales bacterium]|nr:hypothetical protein [Hyphomicrobiales bacterium]